MISKTTKLLKTAKAKITDRSRWCKNAFAKNKDGSVVPSDCDAAYIFCALGAINSTVGGTFSKAHTLLYQASRRLGYDGVAGLNDHARTSHAKAIKLYDNAIRASQRADKKKSKSKK